jgi:stage V sporulation protein D (sporulation-specific penicillin-binding protein)
MQIKLLAIFAFVLFALIIILIRIAYINIHSGQSYAKQVLSQKNYDSQTLASRRGEIQDTNGRLLAYSEKVYNVVLDCVAINEDEAYIEPTIKVLNEVFGLDSSELRERITGEKTKDSQYQVVMQKISESLKEEYEEYIAAESVSNVTGVWFEEEFVRRYPLNSLASNVIGFSNSIGDGIIGLESYYDEQLQGTDGRVFGYLNEDQEYEKKTIAPENGYTLQTTLDVNIQEVVEKYIQEFDDTYGDEKDDGTAKHGAENIGVIVMNPNDGSILAMATNSSFDLNNPQDLSAWYTESEIKAMTDEQYVEALNDMWNNFCVSDAYEPGSTFKPITISSALECGAITANDYFYCDGGEFITDTEIHCDVYPYSHGEESVGDSLKNSCNDALMQIGMKMGITRFLNYQSLYNFGKQTGIDLPNESTGSVYNRETMNEVELATCTFGQGLTCTMVQQAAAISAVVNGGYYYQPHVVDKILNENGKVVKDSSKLLLKQTVSSDVSELLRTYMERVVEEGTGTSSQIPGYRIGGKTGTAEKIDPETGARAAGKYLVSFIGAVPINNPEVVIYVVVDEPNVDDQAHSTFAQEIFRNIAVSILPYMEIYPTEDVTEEMLAELGLTTDDLGDAAAEVITFQAFDSYGNLYSDARVVDGQVVDSAGNVLAGAYIADDGTVYDGYGNAVSSVEVTTTAQDEESVAENPNMALPPSENGEGSENDTVWDGTATDDQDTVIENQ